MPAAPELLDGGRGVRIIEVFAEMEAEHASETDGHIAVAGKIEVDLQRVANGARQSCQHADLSGRQREHGIRHLTERVRQQQLFAQTADKPANAECGLLRCGATAVDLLLDVMVFDDRPGDQLREKRDVQQHLLERVRDRLWLTVHVDDVGKSLKGEERDADGQRNAGQRQTQPAQCVHCADSKIRILEHGEQPYPADDRECDTEFGVLSCGQPSL